MEMDLNSVILNSDEIILKETLVEGYDGGSFVKMVLDCVDVYLEIRFDFVIEPRRCDLSRTRLFRS